MGQSSGYSKRQKAEKAEGRRRNPFHTAFELQFAAELILPNGISFVGGNESGCSSLLQNLELVTMDSIRALRRTEDGATFES
jgi:hypothetical protein